MSNDTFVSTLFLDIIRAHVSLQIPGVPGADVSQRGQFPSASSV